MIKNLSVVILSAVFILILAAQANAQFQVNFETGVAISTINDLRIPGDTGTDISFVDDLASDPGFVYRINLEFKFYKHHNLRFLFAPFRTTAEGFNKTAIQFNGETFPANSYLTGKYRFDSYRLTYRYDFFLSDEITLGIGFSAKIRDASLSLSGNDKTTEKVNTGFVPLINFLFRWDFHKDTALIFKGDALAAPQGRAEDVLLALNYKTGENSSLYIGYRLLEGGADNDEVYTFALVHYFVIGAYIIL